MNRLVGIVAVAFLAAAFPLLMASAELPGVAAAEVEFSAAGHGSMAFGHQGEGRGYFKFDLQQVDGQITGTLLFAAEAHHEMMFPNVIVRLSNIEKSSFGRHRVKFSGQGALHNDPVSVTVTAYDNASSRKADRFVIKCVGNHGKVIFEADGEVFLGDLTVGPAAD